MLFGIEKKYKIIRISSKKEQKNPWELYDLLMDPYEENDLAKKFPAVVERMNQEFTVWAKSAKADEQKVLDKYHSAKTKEAKQKK